MLSSSRLASLAGTTVRALRHYHQLGLLPEPQRSSNGYREYSVSDLVRVLRIRTLAELGIALERMPALLDDRSADGSATLNELDAELTATIDRLSRQRAALAVIRDEGLAPDLRPEIARMSTLMAAVSTPALRAIDEELSTLFLHLAGDSYIPLLEGMYTGMGDVDAVRDITSRFDALRSAEPGDAAIAPLAADYARLMAPTIALLREQSVGMAEMPAGADALLQAYNRENLGPAQLEMLHLLATALETEDILEA